MKHSNQIREFLITPHGIRLEPVYVGPEGVLTGSMRAAQEAREKAAQLEREQQTERKHRELSARRSTLEAQIRALQAEVEAVEQEASVAAAQDAARERTLEDDRTAAALRRGGVISMEKAAKAAPGKATMKGKGK
ncbi:MAG TPA: hypothetical protein VFY49_10185 [Myxococcota bacterium]|nr:hypothetical protein [Myxococcota bacterium]